VKNSRFQWLFSYRWYLLVVILLCFACSSRSTHSIGKESFQIAIPPAQTQAGPKLRVAEVYPRMGFAPLHVSVHVILDGVLDGDKSFQCLTHEWFFGDGSVSGEKPNCDASEMETEFFGDHVYQNPGTYIIRFKLDEPNVISNQVSINVIERPY